MPDTDPKFWSLPSLLDREADARFWAQTHYKIGRKLNPSDRTDRAMAKIWRDIRAKVGSEDRAGKLALTYNDPTVERRLGDARLASQAADAHVSAAIAEPDLAIAGRHAAAAAVAAAAASTAAHEAADAQPPTVSPIVADAAAQEAAEAAGLPSPLPVSPNLPSDHPAVSSEAAGPVLHPDMAQDPMPPESTLSAPLHVDHGPRQLDLARAITSPSVAVTVHERAAQRQAAGALPAQGTLHPQTLAQIRAVAAELAHDSAGSFLGVNYAPDERWSVPLFRSADEMHAWYGHLTDTPDAFRYLATFDKTSPSWPAPVNEVFGSGKAIGVNVHVSSGSDGARSKTNYGPIFAVGAVGVIALGAIIADQTRKSRRHS